MDEEQSDTVEDADAEDDKGQGDVTEHVNVEGDATKTTSEGGETAGNETDEPANDILAIVRRDEQQEFPLITTHEQNCMTTEEAKGVLELVQAGDTVELQTYIKEQYHLFCRNESKEQGESDAVFHAEWARNHYYVHIKNLYSPRGLHTTIKEAICALVDHNVLLPQKKIELEELSNTLEDRHLSAFLQTVDDLWAKSEALLPSFARSSSIAAKNAWFSEQFEKVFDTFHVKHTDSGWKFKPEIQLCDLEDSAARSEAKTLLQKVTPSMVPSITTAVNRAYSDAMAELPAFAQTSMGENTRKHFLLTEYYTIVAKVVSSAHHTPSFKWTPAVAVEELPTNSAQEKAKLLITKVRQCHVEKIESAVKSEYAKIAIAEEPWIGSEVKASLRSNWLRTHYYAIVENVVTPPSSSAKPMDSFTFIPDVPVDALATSEAREKAKLLVEKVSKCHADSIKSKVEEEYAKVPVPEASWLTDEVKESLHHTWLLANYFGIVESIVTEATSPQISPATSPTLRPTDNTALFNNPPKRAKRTGQEISNLPITNLSVHDIHMGDAVFSQAIGLRGKVMHYSDDPRLVTMRNKTTGLQEPISVLSVLLADRTGPIMLECWREKAEETLRLLSMWSQSCPDNEPLQIEVQRALVREDSRAHPTPMRKLYTTDQTVIQRVTSMFLESELHAPLSASSVFFTRDFNLLTQTQPTFLISIAGIISNTQEETTSQSGEAMKAFRLQDYNGKYVQCIAFGRHVDNTHLSDRNEVVLYFATALAGRASSPGQLWMYNESHIVKLSTVPTVPSVRQLVELRDGH